jgi:hypothetical protein
MSKVMSDQLSAVSFWVNLESIRFTSVTCALRFP